MTTKAKGWHAGRALRELTGDGRVAAEEIAMQLGVASASIYRYFRAAELPERIAKRIAPKLGVTVEWLMTGRGQKFIAGPEQEAQIEARLERMIVLHTRQQERETRALIARVVKAVSGLQVLETVD